MRIAARPSNEQQRLSALAAYKILDSAPETYFNDLVSSLAKLCEVPMAFVCFVDSDRRWIKAKVGDLEDVMQRDATYCAHVVSSAKPLVVEDSLSHEISRGDPSDIFQKVRFYAGAPLINRDGYCIGTLSLADFNPKKITEHQSLILESFAKHIMNYLELRQGVEDLSTLGTELSNARDRAVEANESNLNFIESMSHEMRTSMNGILGMTEIIGQETKDPEVQQHSQSIESIGGKMLTMMDNILDLALMEKSQVEFEENVFSPQQVVSEVCRLVAPTAHNKKLDLNVFVDLDPKASFHADEKRVKQVLMNLLNNAVHFTSAGEVNLLLAYSVGHLWIEVSDHPSPLPKGSLAEHLEKKFSSEAVLPITSEKKLRVLIAEDNPVNQLLLRKQVESLGYDCEVVGDGEAAVNAFKVSPFDAVLMDCQMPKMDGYEAAKQIRSLEGKDSNKKRLPIIALTATTNSEESDKCKQSGIDSLLAKPILVTTLSSTLNRLGIRKNSFDKIFSGFKNAETEALNTVDQIGLGLAVSKKIIEAMNGSFAIVKKSEQSNSLILKLPITEAAIERSSLSVVTQYTNKHVLVVDDNSTSADYTRRILESWGAKVSIIDEGRLAINHISDKADSNVFYNLVLIDAYMADVDGFAVAKFVQNLKSAQPIPIVMMLGTTDTLKEQKVCAQMGINRCVIKPLLSDELRASVDSYLGAIDTFINEGAPSIAVAAATTHLDRILIVDDNYDNCLLVKAFLKNKPYELVMAPNGAKAVELFKSQRFDIVLMDLQMPEMNGFEALSHMRAWEESQGKSQTPILAITARVSTSDFKECLKAGFVDFLAKPLKSKELMDKLSKYMDQSNPWRQVG